MRARTSWTESLEGQRKNWTTAFVNMHKKNMACKTTRTYSSELIYATPASSENNDISCMVRLAEEMLTCVAGFDEKKRAIKDAIESGEHFYFALDPELRTIVPLYEMKKRPISAREQDVRFSYLTHDDDNNLPVFFTISELYGEKKKRKRENDEDEKKK